MSFETYQTELAPPWHRTREGELLNGTLGSVKDELEADLHAATLARLARYAPEDALALLGEECGLRRYPREALEVWRRRVQHAWTYWSLAGTIRGVEIALEAAGYRAVVVEHYQDPDPTHWAEFSVTLTPLNPIVRKRQWGGGLRWGGGDRWGGLDPNGTPLDALADLVREVKPAHTRLRRLTYRNRARYWGGDLRWGEGREGAQPGVDSGWGTSHGVPFIVAPTGSDSGPRWGGEPEIVLYDINAQE